MAPRVVVIGGGPAGCAGARALARLGCEAAVLEAEDELGGRTRTVRRGGFTIDTGAVFLFGSYRRTLELIGELGRADRLVPMRAPSGFHDGRELHVFRPMVPPSWLRYPLVGWRDKARLALRSTAAGLWGPDIYDGESMHRAERGLTLESWARGTFGERAYEYGVRPQIEPILGAAGDLPSHVLWSGLARAAWRVPPWRPPALAVRGGIGSLCEWLAESAQAAATPASVRTEARVRSLRTGARGVCAVLETGEEIDADAALLATDAHAAAAILDEGGADGWEPAHDAASALAEIRYAGSIHVSVAYRRDPWPGLRPWAFVPVGPGPRAAVGVSLLGRKCPASVPDGAEMADVFIGDHGFRSGAAEDPAAAALEAVERCLGPAGAEPEFVCSFVRERGLVPPRPGSLGLVARARGALPPRVRLAGDYASPGGIETAVREGERAAAELAAALAGSDPPNVGSSSQSWRLKDDRVITPG